MAKIRIGFSTHFEVENELVGIGTDNPTNTKQVLGNIHASNVKAIGISTFATYQGFLDKEARFGKSVIDINSQAGNLAGDVVIDGDVTVSSGSTLCSGVDELSLTDSFSVPTGNTDSRIHCQTAGSMRFNEDLGTLEFYTGDEWRTVNSIQDTGNRGRALVHCGGGEKSTVEFLTIASRGNGQHFGDLTVGRQLTAAASSSTRGLFAGGLSPSVSDVIDYVTIQSQGNGIAFGNLTASGRTSAGASSSTRGIIANINQTNVINYVEISTLGDALDFGDLTNSSGSQGTACSSPVRMLYQSGNSTPSTLIESLTIASKGNTVRFGELSDGVGTEGVAKNKALSNSIRGVFTGGYSQVSPYPARKHMQYVTIASEGNSTTFGDMTELRWAQQTTGSQTRGIIAGGAGDAPNWPSTNTIESIEYASLGNGVFFGELSSHIGRTNNGSALSDCHGGLGGF